MEDAMKTEDLENERRWVELRERPRWTADEAKWVLEAQGASGETVRDFAEQRGLPRKRLYDWRVRLKNKRAKAQPKPAGTRPMLLPVTVRPAPGPTPSDCGVVVSTGGVRVEVRELNATSRSWVAELLGL